MNRQELIVRRDRLMRELNETNKEIARLDEIIQNGKIKKVYELLEELWVESKETFEIENYSGDTIYIDFEDLLGSIKKHFGI